MFSGVGITSCTWQEENGELLGLGCLEHPLRVKSLQKANLEEKLHCFDNLLHSLIKFCITPELPKNCDALETLQRNI